MRWKSASTSASTVWSQRTAIPRPPRSVTSRSVSSIVPGTLSVVGPRSTLRPDTYTVAPAAPSASAMPRPAPRLAPVTSAMVSFIWNDRLTRDHQFTLLVGSRNVDDEFALVIAGAEESKRVGRIRKTVHLVDHRRQRAGFEQLVDVSEV